MGGGDEKALQGRRRIGYVKSHPNPTPFRLQEPSGSSEQHFVGERLLDVLPDHPRHRPGAHQFVVGGNVMS
jgi:hypothetical protein